MKFPFNYLFTLGMLLAVAGNIHAQSGKQEIKDKALQVLSKKCNVCHIKKNPRRIFNAVTMDTYAQDIYKQVFVKKRMPKGKDVTLSESEYKILTAWLKNKPGVTDF